MIRFRSFVLLACTPSLCSAISVTYPAGVPAGEIDRFAGSADFLQGIPNSSDFDFTGVGQTDGCTTGIGRCRWATLISDRHVVSAAHLSPSIGASISFHDDSGTVLASRSVASGEIISGADLWLGTLSTPVDTATIRPYGLASLSDTQHVGQAAIQVGRSSAAPHFRVGQNRVDAFFSELDPGDALNASDFIVLVDDSTAGAITNTDDAPFLEVPGMRPAPLAYETYLRGGDSGAPSFVDAGGGLLEIVGVHSFIGDFSDDGRSHDAERRVSGDVYLPSYRSVLRAKTATVPEPSALILLGLGGAAIARRPARQKAILR